MSKLRNSTGDQQAVVGQLLLGHHHSGRGGGSGQYLQYLQYLHNIYTIYTRRATPRSSSPPAARYRPWRSSRRETTRSVQAALCTVQYSTVQYNTVHSVSTTSFMARDLALSDPVSNIIIAPGLWAVRCSNFPKAISFLHPCLAQPTLAQWALYCCNRLESVQPI